jgi:hypothetical protein
MTGIRGDRSWHVRVTIAGCVAALVMAALAGCATARPPAADASAPSATPTTSPSPTATAACPIVEGVELPPECAPYDPEHAMALNDRHRERVPLSDDARAAAERSIAAVRPALDALRASGLTTDAVADALDDAGLTGVSTLGDSRAVAVGADAPAGGCIFGEVRPDVVTIDAGGVILDGGCLPAQ